MSSSAAFATGAQAQPIDTPTYQPLDFTGFQTTTPGDARALNASLSHTRLCMVELQNLGKKVNIMSSHICSNVYILQPRCIFFLQKPEAIIPAMMFISKRTELEK
ncbi:MULTISPECIES: hypothetical protein [Pseudomonas]|uniref:hypothetical protein n=1 Tax=Pseudomonas TaxID=286 RepID=UPI00114D3C6F|nr:MULTISPECIES: hypothetical protein [Pseudomonas]MBH3431405.1 hypothetical protein [Pseudomonas citronellolis]